MNLCNWQFFIWIILSLKNSCELFKFEIQILETASDVETIKIDLEKVMQLYSWSHFQMNSFSASNNHTTLDLLQYMKNENVI
jgi:hypothetical protein